MFSYAWGRVVVEKRGAWAWADPEFIKWTSHDLAVAEREEKQQMRMVTGMLRIMPMFPSYPFCAVQSIRVTAFNAKVMTNRQVYTGFGYRWVYTACEMWTSI